MLEITSDKTMVRSTLETANFSEAWRELQAAQGPIGLSLYAVTVPMTECDPERPNAYMDMIQVPRLCGGAAGVIPERVARFNALRIG